MSIFDSLTSSINTDWSQPVNGWGGTPAVDQNGGAATGLDEQNNLNIANAALAQQQGVYGNESGLANLEAANANGTGPDLAAQELANATERNNATSAGAIAAQQGLNPQLAARQIQDTNSSNNMDAASQAAALRMQNQLSAQQQLAALYGQQGQQNLGVASQGFGANQVLTSDVGNAFDGRYGLAA
jgi:hypothetical protein